MRSLLVLKCGKCRKEEDVYVIGKENPWKIAHERGWVFKSGKTWYCPQCRFTRRTK